MEMVPSERCPSLQYMDDVDPGGVADMAGIRDILDSCIMSVHILRYCHKLEFGK
jgi:hypothetical protein